MRNRCRQESFLPTSEPSSPIPFSELFFNRPEPPPKLPTKNPGLSQVTVSQSSSPSHTPCLLSEGSEKLSHDCSSKRPLLDRSREQRFYAEQSGWIFI